MRKGHGRGTLKSFCRGIKRKLKWNFIKFQERKIIQINFTTEEVDKRAREMAREISGYEVKLSLQQHEKNCFKTV